jgi:hypothetical protein
LASKALKRIPDLDELEFDLSITFMKALLCSKLGISTFELAQKLLL